MNHQKQRRENGFLFFFFTVGSHIFQSVIPHNVGYDVEQDEDLQVKTSVMKSILLG